MAGRAPVAPPEARDAEIHTATAVASGAAPGRSIAAARGSSSIGLAVRGLVARDIGIVRLRLESATGAVLAVAAIDPTGHGHADAVPFESRFVVEDASATPEASRFVVVTDGDGTPLDGIRHPYASSLFLVVEPRRVGGAGGAVGTAAPTPGTGPVPRTGSRSLGNDGLIGGIVFGIPMSERRGP